MRKFPCLLFVLKRSYIYYYIICMTVPLNKRTSYLAFTHYRNSWLTKISSLTCIGKFLSFIWVRLKGRKAELKHRVKGALMQIWKSANIVVFIWKCFRFHIKTPFTFWDIRTWDEWKVCLQTFRNNRICWKLAYFLRNLQTSRVNNPRILSIKDAKFSGSWLYINTNI